MDPRIRIHTKMSWIRNTDCNYRRTRSKVFTYENPDPELFCQVGTGMILSDPTPHVWVQIFALVCYVIVYLYVVKFILGTISFIQCNGLQKFILSITLLWPITYRTLKITWPLSKVRSDRIRISSDGRIRIHMML